MVCALANLLDQLFYPLYLAAIGWDRNGIAFYVRQRVESFTCSGASIGLSRRYEDLRTASLHETGSSESARTIVYQYKGWEE